MERIPRQKKLPVTSTEGAIMTYLVSESRGAQNSESILTQKPTSSSVESSSNL